MVEHIKCIILWMMYANWVVNWPGQLVCRGVAPLTSSNFFPLVTVGGAPRGPLDRLPNGRKARHSLSISLEKVLPRPAIKRSLVLVFEIVGG